MNLPPDLEPSPAPSGRPDPIDGLGTPTGSGPPPPPDPTLPSIDPVRIPPDLETRIRRDAQRGRRLVLLTWLIAIANLPLGLVAIRQAVLLADVDRRLVSTPDIRQAAATFEFARVALPIALLLLLALAIPWLLGAVSDLSTLRELGVVDGPSPGHGFRRLALLWRAAGAGPDRAGWIDVRVGDGQSAMRSMAAAVGVAGVVGLAALVGVSQASDADGSRIWHLAAGVDGLIWLASIIVLGIAIDTVSWREAAAARALGVYIPSIDGPGRTLVRLAPPVLIFLAGASAAVGLPHPLVAICPEESRLTCQGMLVAADRDGSSDSTFTIVWAVHHATTAPKGTLAIAVGGPGESGLSESSGILASLDPRLVAAYDILFWDQRGVGASEGADCPEAGAEYAGSKGGAAVIQAFVDACLSEAGVAPADVDRYASVQAAEDLEAIRDRLGIGRFALYGESYGTELAQVYAARHPDRLTALVLDGAIDVTRSANDFWADAAHGFDRVLNDTFLACQDEAGCRAHLADPAAAYDEAFGLFEPQRTVAYADTDGTVRDHQVDAAEVEIAIDTLLYEPAGRMLVARALAASSHGDEVPLARLVAVLGRAPAPESHRSRTTRSCARTTASRRRRIRTISTRPWHAARSSASTPCGPAMSTPASCRVCSGRISRQQEIARHHSRRRRSPSSSWERWTTRSRRSTRLGRSSAGSQTDTWSSVKAVRMSRSAAASDASTTRLLRSSSTTPGRPSGRSIARAQSHPHSCPSRPPVGRRSQAPSRQW